MTTREQITQHLDELEELLRRTVWTRSLETRLARRWGTSPRTVRRMRQRVLRDLVRRRLPPEERRREVILGVEGMIAEARQEKDLRVALGGYKLVAQIEGLLQTAPEVAITLNIERADPLALLQGMASALASVEHAGLLAGPVIDVEEG